MIRDHEVNYSTIRHILAQYYLFGRTEGRKFKYKGKFDQDISIDKLGPGIPDGESRGAKNIMMPTSTPQN